MVTSRFEYHKICSIRLGIAPEGDSRHKPLRKSSYRIQKEQTTHKRLDVGNPGP